MENLIKALESFLDQNEETTKCSMTREERDLWDSWTDQARLYLLHNELLDGDNSSTDIIELDKVV